MKKEYNIKDKVWIAMGERRLVEGRVVEIIDLAHLKENHDPNHEFYIIEVKTGIDDIYEVRDWGQISSTANGPLNMFASIREQLIKNNRYLKKVGIPVPNVEANVLEELAEEIEKELHEDDEVDPDIIHAAIEKSQKENAHQPLNLKTTEKPKRRYYKKKK
jgi:hypothetical protein